MLVVGTPPPPEVHHQVSEERIADCDHGDIVLAFIFCHESRRSRSASESEGGDAKEGRLIVGGRQSPFRWYNRTLSLYGSLFSP